jgi:hypothetical protein
MLLLPPGYAAKVRNAAAKSVGMLPAGCQAMVSLRGEKLRSVEGTPLQA